MKAIIARCGFRCDLCPAFRPNVKIPEDRKKTSAGWRKYFGLRIPPEHIECDGCLSKRENAVLLDASCPVRSCAMERGLANCAACPDFICRLLASRVYAAERAVKKFRGSIPEEDRLHFIRPYDVRKDLEEIRGNKSADGEKNKNAVLKELQKIPGVGKSLSRDLWDIGIRSVQNLKNKSPETLYRKLCDQKKTQVDRCALYVFRCAVYFASNSLYNPELLKWWNWKDRA